MRRLGVVLLLLSLGLNAPAQEAPGADDILSGVAAGLELLETGQFEAAFDQLNVINEQAQGHQPGALATFYPNAALALYFHDIGRWEAALQFSDAAIAGLSSHGLGTHRARIMASAVQGAALFRLGRYDQAETRLRAVVDETAGKAALADLHGMALHYLARAVSRLGGADEAALRMAFLDGLSPIWRVQPRDVVQVRYLQLQYELDRMRDATPLMSRTKALVAEAAAAAGLSDAQRMFYTGFLGRVLLRSGQPAEAEQHLRAHHGFLRAQEAKNRDAWDSSRALGEAMVATQGAQAGYDFLLRELDYAQRNAAPGVAVALYHRDLGRIANGAGDGALAQAQFRAAYALARGSVDATEPLATHLRSFLRADDPAVAAYPFRHEITDPGFQLTLRADAAHVLYLFLQGRFVTLHDHYRTARPDAVDDPALFHINRALFHALSGHPDDMARDLHSAQEAARRGSALHPNAPIFDIVHTLGFIWGTEHAPDRAQPALTRLMQSEQGGTARLLADVLALYAAGLQADRHGLHGGLQRWLANPQAMAPNGPWDVFANTLALELAYGNIAPSRLAPIRRATESAMGTANDYALARTLDRMAHSVLVQSDSFSDAQLAERVVLERQMSDMLPPGHPVLASARFVLANAYLERGEAKRAAEWSDRAIATLRATPHHDRDRLAYLLARHGRILLALGRNDAALSQTTAALALVPEAATMTGTYLGEVLLAHSEALWHRTRNAQKLRDFLSPWVTRDAVMARLLPEARADLLIQTAFANARLGGTAEPEFERADAAMSSPTWDWRSKRSRLANIWAEHRYRRGDLHGAWDKALQATDLLVDWLEDGGDASHVQKDRMRHRAVWEAGIGWALAEKLAE
ncbi:hypothetical protein PGB28_02950 [Primorskyibacter aestuariivivens]|uniref:hypothetical protein n=1 Tax=Primorskyibacter aestuariivivens TaxID=1888912 RepID=UPI002300D5B2|nr:hypothetical protein [Primorskyibacter aestuariivivens]MDA7427403.1 hypothetical protein [Primorskyibacter aestuariivivens]